MYDDILSGLYPRHYMHSYEYLRLPNFQFSEISAIRETDHVQVVGMVPYNTQVNAKRPTQQQHWQISSSYVIHTTYMQQQQIKIE